MTLVCAYFGAWEVTKRYGVPRKIHRPRPDGPTTFTFGSDCSPMPLVVQYDELNRRCYYLWLFGPKIKLPFESKVTPEDGLRAISLDALAKKLKTRPQP